MAVENPCNNLRIQAQLNAEQAFGLRDSMGNWVPGVMTGARYASDYILRDQAWDVGFATGHIFAARLYTCVTIAQASAAGYADDISVAKWASMTPQAALDYVNAQRIQGWTAARASQAAGCTSSPTNPYPG